MANDDNMAAVHRPEDVKYKIINMTQTMINIKEETDQLLRETHRILQEKANSKDTPAMMPETQHFVEEYLLSHKPELEAIDPSTKGTKLRIRRLLAETIHQAIDAVAADIIEGFQVQSKKRGSASSSETLRGREDSEEDGVMGDMSEDEEAGEVDGKEKELGKIVLEEVEELREVVKEAVDDALW